MALGDALAGSPTTSPALVVCAWLTLCQRRAAALQPAARVPARRRPDRTGADLGRDGESRPGTARLSGLAGRALGQLLLVGGLILLWRRDTLPAPRCWCSAGSSRRPRAARSSRTFSERIEGVTAADVMDADPQTIDAETTTTVALQRFTALGSGPVAIPVLGPGRRFLGLLSRDRLEHTLADGRPMLTAAEMLVGEEPDGGQVSSDASLESLLHGDRLHRYGLVPVVDADGTFRGVVTIDHVRRALQV